MPDMYITVVELSSKVEQPTEEGLGDRTEAYVEPLTNEQGKGQTCLLTQS